MKHTDLFEAVGEIDSRYIEDAASHPQRSLMRFARPAAIAAAVCIVGSSAYLVYGIVREAVSQDGMQPGYPDSVAYAPETTAMTDLSEEHAETTTYITAAPTGVPEDRTGTFYWETTVPAETTETASTVPAGEISMGAYTPENMPEVVFFPEIGKPFRFSPGPGDASGWMMAVAEEPVLYDNIFDAGVDMDELLWKEHSAGDSEYVDFETGEILPDPLYGERYFIKTTVTIQNVNAEWLWVCTGQGEPNAAGDAGSRESLPDNARCRTEYGGRWSSFPDGFPTDEVYQTLDFRNKFNFRVIADTDIGKQQGLGNLLYCNLIGQPEEIILDETGCWYLFQPGDVVTYEVGSVIAKRATEYTERDYHIPAGENLVPYYCLCTGSSLTKPYIRLNLTEP